MWTELTYRLGDAPMDPKPVNRALFEVCQGLRRGYPQAVTLEPGDMTRYDLLITPLRPAVDTIFHYGFSGEDCALLVTRVIGGDPRGSTVVINEVSYGELEIAHGNEWSGILLRWWLNGLLVSMREAA